MRKLLLLLLVSGLGGALVAQTGNTELNRGASDDAGLAAAQRSVENQITVEEIEGAGFEIDVEEGFDEEWEEEIWVDTEAEDVDAESVDRSEAARLDLEALAVNEDEAGDVWTEETWENPELATDEHDDVDAHADTDDDAQALGTMRGDDLGDVEDAEVDSQSELSLGDGLEWEDESDVAESNWWDESSENWTAELDEMDMDGLEGGYDEEEDLDLLEELYFEAN